MNPRHARRIAWSLVVLYIILAAVGLTLQSLAGAPFTQTPLPLLIVLMILVGVLIATGALIVSRHPRHPVGWLLCLGLFTSAIDIFASGYASYSTYVSSGPLPGEDLALVWLNLFKLGPQGLVIFTLTILLFPDGGLPSPGWRKVVQMTIGALIVFLPLQAVEPGIADSFSLPTRSNPLGISTTQWVILNPLMWTIYSILVLCYGAAFISLFVRLRHSRGEIRQQIKWLLFPAGLYGLFLLLFIMGKAQTNDALVEMSIAVGQAAIAGIVITIAFAIFKYRLYDIDLIINRTMVYGTLTAFSAGLYVLIVGGAVLVIQNNANLAALLITAVLVGVMFRPMRAFLQRVVDRMLSGSNFAPNASPGDKDQHREVPVDPTPGEDVGKAPRWMSVARAAWYPAAAVAFGLFLVSIPGFIILALGGLTDSRFSPNPSLLVRALGWISAIGASGTTLVSLLLAVLLYRRRANDPMALLTSFFLMVYGIIMAGAIEALEPFITGISSFNTSVLMPIFIPFILLLFAVFPDGRFVPRWSRWAVAVAFLTTPVAFYWSGLYTESPLDFSHPITLIASIVAVLLAAAVWTSTFYAQIYRFRSVSTSMQKQQAKWVIFGIGIWLSAQMVSSIPWVYSYSLPSGTILPLWLAAASPIWVVSIAAIPITLSVAILRYKLFEIDVIINRTILYAGLTIVVVGIYVLIVGVLGAFFQAQGNLLIALIATGLVAVLFQPLRERLQRGINRLIYGERDDPLTILRRLGKQLEMSGTPEEILPAILETITHALKLPFAEITLQHRDEFEHVARHGTASTEIIPFPIQYQGQTIGSLNVTARSPGESLSESDLGLLHQIARQAGPVAYTFKLTQDLRQSRAQLVTAREEERRRLRRDLHDGLGPVLAGQGLKIAAVSHLLATEPERAITLLNELASQNEATVGDIRRLVYALRPPELDELGLIGALRDYIGGLNTSSSNGTKFQINAIPMIEQRPETLSTVEVAAYRIATEALTNVTRHAQARHCTISFNIETSGYGNMLHLEIADDGVGLGEEKRSGIGLNSMRERTEEVGGEFHLESGPDRGTKVIAKFPLLD